MSDVLALLAELDKEDQKANAPPSRGKPVSNSKAKTKTTAKSTTVQDNTKRNASIGSSHRTPLARSARPTSLPPVSHQVPRPTLSPGRPESSYSERPRSSYTPSLRKISFADRPRPPPQRLRIPTLTDALPSGFPYNTRLFKYGVTAEEWNRFSREIVEAAQVPMHTHVPALSWTWTFHKSKVTKGVKQQMMYESSDLNREMKRWNRVFKRQGFQVTLQLPNEEEERERGGPRYEELESKGDKEQAKLDSRKFRMIITPNAEKAPASIYSRSSSLARTVTGEGSISTRLQDSVPEVDVEDGDVDRNDVDGKEGDSNSPGPEPYSEASGKGSSTISPQEFDSHPVFSDSQYESDIPSPESDAAPKIVDEKDHLNKEQESKLPVEQEKKAPHVETESKEIMARGRQPSKSVHPVAKPKPRAQSLHDFLTTAGGFDDWNNMDDDD